MRKVVLVVLSRQRAQNFIAVEIERLRADLAAARKRGRCRNTLVVEMRVSYAATQQMSDATAVAKRFEGIWSGYAQGSNCGKVLLRIKRRANTANSFTARAILCDERLGITEAWLSGLISGGDKAEFRLVEVRGLAPLVPREGGVVLNLKEDGTGEGQWQTDIGTAGAFRIVPATFGTIGWYLRSVSAKASFAWHKWLALIYGSFLVLLAIISIFWNTNISYSALILLLVPVPFVFRRQLAKLIALIHSWRIKKLGPIEFDLEQTPPTEEIFAAARLQAQDGVVFAYLNQFFVLRTRMLLAVLAHSTNGISTVDFRNLALSFGVPAGNVDVTIDALVQAKCAQIQNEWICATALGQRYVQAGLRLA